MEYLPDHMRWHILDWSIRYVGGSCDPVGYYDNTLEWDLLLILRYVHCMSVGYCSYLIYLIPYMYIPIFMVIIILCTI